MVRVEKSGLSVDADLAEFIETEALPGRGVWASVFWDGLARLIEEFGPRNRALLDRRQELQAQIDAWHLARRGQPHDAESYRAFLREIGYLEPDVEDFSIDPGELDPEIASVAGPQLVVPITNARFALNAANARWGSLFDALYGTDALAGDSAGRRDDGRDGGGALDGDRVRRVIGWARDHLDRTAPLAGGSWRTVRDVSVRDGMLLVENDAGQTGLADPSQYVGHRPPRKDGCREVILRRHGLHLRLVFDPRSPVAQMDRAGMSDIVLEAALSVIMDLEDSVATVDAADKVAAYRNWLGLMQGGLQSSFIKNGREVWRSLAGDVSYVTPEGEEAVLKGRALMMVRNVGHLMTTASVLDAQGNEIGEGLLDAAVTTLIACHDLRRHSSERNSHAGSVYVVKPKMHGSAEVAFAVEMFARIEELFGLAANTVKLGIMDEERRTSANLKTCIHAARHRLAFINTGFLDRTGDEIHTSMEAGPMVRKGDMKDAAWIAAYEDRNVDIGLACGLRGRAQIGKGMWAVPDRMADMLAQKVEHPLAGANCAWVPSPTAAVLHATHYHLVDVFARQAEIAARGPRASLAQLLEIPLGDPQDWSSGDIAWEVDNNAQGILGYVVRWIDQGVGCSTVPDIRDIGLMEDRATCRISSQALANWLHHGVIDEGQVMAAMKKMAAVVDRQNAGDPLYQPMAPGFDGLAFRAACDLVFQGRSQPSGYTEPILHARRQQRKAEPVLR